MNNAKLLESLGLNEKESSIYLAALEGGASTISDIADRANIKRTTVHSIIPQLLQKGLLVSTIKTRRILYVATPPDDLQKMMEERLARFAEILPQLRAFGQMETDKPRVRLYEGIDGLMRLYNDQLHSAKEIFAFVGVQGASAELRRRLQREYVPRRVSKKIWAYVIAPDTPESIKYREADGLSLRQTKLISHKDYPFSVSIEIYGDKVAVLYYSNTESFGLLIESKEIANSMKSIFNFFWKHV